MIPWLDTPVRFPPANTALDEPNGLLAAGGDLSVATLLNAYQQGIFPWYEPPDPILWWTPNPRTVLFPEQLHISRSLAKTLRNNPFVITCDQAFTQVMQHCAAPRDYTDNTWISSDMVQAYTRLHQQGSAHSVEAWQNDKLVGGLYGVAIGQVFFGESMFSLVSNASKVAFVHLVQSLQQSGFQIIDCQVASKHLHSLGAIEIDREQFLKILAQATRLPPLSSPWEQLNEPRQ